MTRLAILFVGAILAVACPAAASACTVTQAVTTTLGTYSPAAIRAAAVPALQSRAGIRCDVAVLTLLGSNYLRARFTSANGFRLNQQGGTARVTYRASADAGGTVPFAQGTTVDYFQNNLLNVLGLLGSSAADMPFFVKPDGGTLPPVGTYTDQVTIGWAWNQCIGVAALGACVGTTETGTGTSTIDVTLVVSPQNVVMTTSSVTTWDPVNTTSNPRDLPGARRRSSLAVTNPDIVALDPGTLALTIATPPRLLVALDGDGASAGAAIRIAQGSPASGVTLRYVAPADTTDDVDFSADGGATWTYTPVAGDIASQKQITHVRLRPQGSMARQSTFTVSLPYMVF